MGRTTRAQIYRFEDEPSPDTPAHSGGRRPRFVMRDAALRADRVHVSAGSREGPKKTVQEATETARAILRGRCVVVDCFEADGRRYFLAVRCLPQEANPRALTKREADVVLHAVRGESHKLIAYRLGLSRSSVTKVLRSVMGKLSLRTQAQLVLRIACLARLAERGIKP
jgi:DNA-binding NarL/FixJ family response regulator